MAERESLSSRLGFILLSAGCAIGLGNVWRFPYITGRYGGAVFVLIYLGFLLIMGLPIMVMEFSIGRGGKQNIVTGQDQQRRQFPEQYPVGLSVRRGRRIRRRDHISGYGRHKSG